MENTMKDTSVENISQSSPADELEDKDLDNVSGGVRKAGGRKIGSRVYTGDEDETDDLEIQRAHAR